VMWLCHLKEEEEEVPSKGIYTNNMIRQSMGELMEYVIGMYISSIRQKWYNKYVNWGVPRLNII
jgi:hypothetical protein